jgi:hypothetical protein
MNVHFLLLSHLRSANICLPTTYVSIVYFFRQGRGVDHPTPPSAEVKEIVELYIYSPLWAFVTCYSVYFTFTLPAFLPPTC